jgi:hypothetical protein
MPRISQDFLVASLGGVLAAGEGKRRRDGFLYLPSPIRLGVY